MAPREEVGFAPQVERLGVFADAGDSFRGAAPAAIRDPNAGAAARSLAEALGSINRGLQPFVRANIQDARRTDAENRATFRREEEVRGRAAAAKAGAEAGKAVLEGIIPPNASPYFISGVKQQMGRNLARDHADGLNRTLQEVDPLTDDISETINTYNREFRESNLGLTDAQIFAGFAPLQGQIENNARASFFSQQAAAVRKQKMDGTGIEIGHLLDEARDRATQAGTTINTKLLKLQIAEIAKSDRFVGLPGRMLNEAVAAAVMQHAIEHKDSTVLDLLDFPRTDPHDPSKTLPTINTVPAIRSALEKTREKIENMLEHDENQARAHRNEKRVEANNAYTNFVASKLLNDPYAELTDDEVDYYTKQGVSDVVLKFRAKRQQLINGEDVPTLPETRAKVQHLIRMERVSYQDLFSMTNKEGLYFEGFGNLRINFKDYATFASIINTQKQAGGSTLRHPAFTRGLVTTRNSLKPRTNPMTGLAFDDIDGSAVKNFQDLWPEMEQQISTEFASKYSQNMSDSEAVELMGEIVKKADDRYRPRIYTEAARLRLEKVTQELSSLPDNALRLGTKELEDLIARHFIRGFNEQQKQEFFQIVKAEVIRRRQANEKKVKAQRKLALDKDVPERSKGTSSNFIESGTP